MLQLTIKLMNSHSITSHFIHSNEDYNSSYNSHLVYQTCSNKPFSLQDFHQIFY